MSEKPDQIITVVVAGQPEPQPRPRCTCVGGNPHIYHTGRLIAAWRRKVRAAILNTKWARVWKPIEIVMDFNIKRPRSHFRSGKYSHLVRSEAPTYHTSGGYDLDNLIKPVLDEMKLAEMIKDDSQAIKITATKHWVSQSPSCVFSLIELSETEVEAIQSNLKESTGCYSEEEEAENVE